MAITLDLNKSQQKFQLSLQKKGIITPPIVECVIDMDVSRSFEDEHDDGSTNDFMTRIVPWGMTLDPDKKLDVTTFSNGPANVTDHTPIDMNNYKGYVRKHIIGCKGYNGGTDYSYALERNLKNFGWIASDAPKKQSFFGFGKKSETSAPAAKKRSLVIFVTDGDNNDHSRTMEVLKASEQREDEIYFLFVGISNQGSKFPFLEKIGDAFNNTGFVHISDIKKFVQKSDEELNDLFLQEELVEWLKK